MLYPKNEKKQKKKTKKRYSGILEEGWA